MVAKLYDVHLYVIACVHGGGGYLIVERMSKNYARNT